MFSTNKTPSIVIYLVLLAFALRFYQNFGSYLQPGINGGYYPVQVRSILKTGRLAYMDTPLIFYFQALLSFLLNKFTAYNLSSIILFVTKFTDTLIPPLVLFPIYAFLRKRCSVVGSSLIASMSVFSIFILQGLSGDFTKNSAALALLGFYYVELYRKKRNIFKLILLFILTSLTHKTGLLLATITTAILISSKLKFIKDLKYKRMVIIILVISVLFQTILSFLSPSVLCMLLSNLKIVSTENYIGLIFTWAITLILLVAVTEINEKIPHEILVSIIMLIFLTLNLSSLLLGKSYAERFWFLSTSTLVFALILGIKYIREKWRFAIYSAIAIYTTFSILYFFQSHKLPIIKETAYKEIMLNLPTDPNSIVVAEHGIDWWIAFATKNKVAQDGILVDKYSKIYYVNYYPRKEVYAWFGTVTVPESAELHYDGEYIKIYVDQK